MATASVFCSELSQATGEGLAATASRVEHWLLIEYRGLWARDELSASVLAPAVKDHVRAQLGRLRRSRLAFVRRPERRSRDGLAVFYGRTAESDPWIRSLELSGYEDLLELDLAAALEGTQPAAGAPLDHPLFVVCTHGKRDRCCARYGHPLYEGLRDAADEGWVWQSTHVGGDRFAGNVVCLPDGVYYGRVGRLDALAVLEEHLAGRVALAHYRGRCCHSFPVQAAEREIRVRSGVRGIADVRLTSVERRGDDEWAVRMRAGRTAYEVGVAAELGEMTQLTCASPTAKRPRRYVARSVRTLPGSGA